MPDTPLHTLILAARAEGADELADAAEAQLRGLLERDPVACVESLRQSVGPEALAMVSYGHTPTGASWYVTLSPLPAICPEYRGTGATLPAALQALRTPTTEGLAAE